jgi:acetoin utilization protein AcuC
VALFHEKEYLDTLESLNTGLEAPAAANRPLSRFGLGYGDSPVFPGIYSGSLLVAGGALEAAHRVAEGEFDVAFHMAGGLHHAMPGRASGFCYLNDPAIAIWDLVKRGKRVVYLDIDAHHGDGVQHAFYHTDRVLTLSLHESGEFLFPGTGFADETGEGEGKGFSVNLPFLPGTGDETFVRGFEAIVPPLVEAFAPDVLVTQLGVDTFATDPLAHLNLTTHGFCRMVERMKSFHIPWVALGGGGYQISNVARAWALAFGLMSDVELPEEIPPACVKALREHGLTGTHLRDSLIAAPEPTGVSRWMEKQVQMIQETVFPVHGL